MTNCRLFLKATGKPDPHFFDFRYFLKIISVSSVVDRHHFDADLDLVPDPTFHCDVDPDRIPSPSFTHDGKSEFLF
jgi:hypothetical protein